MKPQSAKAIDEIEIWGNGEQHRSFLYIDEAVKATIDFYRQEPYGQAEVETEVFGLTGSAEATKRRKKLTELEQASFSGQAGATGGALGRERAGSF